MHYWGWSVNCHFGLFFWSRAERSKIRPSRKVHRLRQRTREGSEGCGGIGLVIPSRLRQRTREGGEGAVLNVARIRPLIVKWRPPGVAAISEASERRRSAD